MAHKMTGTKATSAGCSATATRLTLTLAATLLVCMDSACTAPHDSADSTVTTDSAVTAVTTDSADTAITTDTPPTSGAPDPDTSPGSNGASDSSDSATTDDASTGAAEPPGACDFSPALPVDCAEISRIVPIGTGVSEAHVARRHFRVEDAAGAVLGAEFHACLRVTDSECQVAPVALEPAPSRSITALLVRPHADPAANAALAEALADFIDGRPEGERIGVYRWGAAVTQISTPTADRGRLHRLVASGLQPLDVDSIALTDAIEAIVDPLVSIDRDGHMSLRQLLVVAPGHAPGRSRSARARRRQGPPARRTARRRRGRDGAAGRQRAPRRRARRG
jgi:hypothetical protein